MTQRHKLRAALICFALAIALLLLAGCATPYSRGDWAMLGYAVAGQGADCASAAYALDRGFVERNDILYGDSPSWRDMAKVKVPLLLLAWVCGEIWPGNRELIYGIVGTVGFAAGTANTITIWRD